MARKSLETSSKKKEKEEPKNTFSKEQLVKALDRLSPGLLHKSLIPQMSHYLFMKDRIATYNENISVEVPFDIGFSGSVPAEEFYKLLNKVPSKDIQLSLEGEQIVVKAGSSSFGLAYTQPEAIHQQVEQLEEARTNWLELTGEAKQAMVLCSFSTSRDSSKPALRGVLVGNNEVLSSDNYRISWYQLKEGQIRRLFLPVASSLVHLIKYDVKEYCLVHSWIHFRGEGIVFSSRLLEEEFPQKAKEFFPKEDEIGEGFELPKTLLDLLDKALVLLIDDFLLDKKVTLTFQEDEILCEASKPNLGWFRESVPLKNGPKESVVIEANPIFLKEVAKHATKVFILENKLLFISGNFKHLISL